MVQRAAVATALAVMLLIPGAAGAATFNVNTTDDENGAGAACSLREAIEAANTDGDFGGCGGPLMNNNVDTIVLTAGLTYGRTVTGIDGPLTIDDEVVTINANGATIAGTDTIEGRGVFEISGDAVASINGATIRDGVDDYGGGLELSDSVGGGSPSLRVSNSTITSNAAGDGGGIDTFLTEFGELELTNVTISGNAASSAGGVDLEGAANGNGFSVLRNVTITNNSAGGSGGGGLYVSDPSTHVIMNSIVAGNTATSAERQDCFVSTLSGPTFVSAGRTLIGDTAGCPHTAGPGDLTGPAGLGPLASNGGPTQTHGLQIGSQAIDAGNPFLPNDGAGTHCEPIDQRGVARPVGSFCDMGAYEGTLPLPPLPAPTVTPPVTTETFDLAAAIKQCKKKRTKAKRKKCIRRARERAAAG